MRHVFRDCPARLPSGTVRRDRPTEPSYRTVLPDRPAEQPNDSSDDAAADVAAQPRNGGKTRIGRRFVATKRPLPFDKGPSSGSPSLAGRQPASRPPFKWFLVRVSSESRERAFFSFGHKTILPPFRPSFLIESSCCR